MTTKEPWGKRRRRTSDITTFTLVILVTLVWVFQKLLICWDLRTRPSVRFTEEDRKIQRTQDCWVKTACLCQRRMKRVTQIITTKLCRRAGVSAQHAEPSAAEDHTCQARTGNVDQNLWGMFPATCWIWVTKSQFSWSEQSVPNDVAYRCVYIYGSCWELLPSRVYRDQNEWIHHRCEYVTHFSFKWGAAAYLDEFPIICLLPQLFTVFTGTGMLVWQGEWEVGWKYICQFSFWTFLTSCNFPLLHTSCSEAWLTELL